MKMNKIALSVGAAILGLTGIAQAEISANVGATSNYVWRGVTQTKDEAAISGGIDYANESGVYVGTWASNINWGSPATDDTGVEVDFYGGYGGEMSGFGYDVGLIYYGYPQHSDSDFVEFYGSVSYSVVTAGLAYTVSGENDGGQFDDGDVYYYLSAGIDLDDGWSVGGTVGYYDFDNATAGEYTHFQADVTKSAGDFGDFTLSASVADDDGAGVDEDTRVFVSWSKSF